ncbi:hypothetical protein ABPG74_005509 [Tetrahymena malaccensis]
MNTENCQQQQFLQEIPESSKIKEQDQPLKCHKLCKHERNCIVNAVDGFLKSLGIGLGIKTITNILFFMLSKKKSLQTFKALFLTTQNVQLPLFLATMTGTMRGVICLLRYLRKKEDGYNAFISGFIAGFLSLQMIEKKSWYVWKMFFFSRCIDGIYNHYCNNGTIKKKVIHYSYGYMISSFLIAYCYFLEPFLLNKSLVKLYNNFAQLGQNEKLWHWCSIIMNANQLSSIGL